MSSKENGKGGYSKLFQLNNSVRTLFSLRFLFLLFLSLVRYSQYQRMLSTLSQCEFSMGKTLLVYDMNLREMENYEKIYKEIGKHSASF